MPPVVSRVLESRNLPRPHRSRRDTAIRPCIRLRHGQRRSLRNHRTEPDMRPFDIQRIDHVVLRVTDIDRSRRFYVDVLGCRIARERPDLGLVHLRAGASMIDLVDVRGRLGQRGGDAAGETRRNVDHVCLRIEPFDEATIRAHLISHGIDVAEPASTNFGAEGDGPSLYIRDPDGNAIELKGPASG
jgi:catechol 2,3-dioxygenase-like lactoylglutathione lyase family enzyme